MCPYDYLKRASNIPIHLHSLPCGVHNHFLTDWWGRVDDPLDSSSPEGRVKGEGENRGYESSSEESVGEENNRDNSDTDESIEEDEKGVEDNIGDWDTDEEEDGAVTSNIPIHLHSLSCCVHNHFLTDWWGRVQ
jgi:hypothetical protein